MTVKLYYATTFTFENRNLIFTPACLQFVTTQRDRNTFCSYFFLPNQNNTSKNREGSYCEEWKNTFVISITKVGVQSSLQGGFDWSLLLTAEAMGAISVTGWYQRQHVCFPCRFLYLMAEPLVVILVISGNGWHPRWLTTTWLITDGHQRSPPPPIFNVQYPPLCRVVLWR